MNIKNWFKYILYVIFIILIVVLQTTFLGSLNPWLANFNLIVACLVLLIELADYRGTLFFALTAGWLMDVYSGLPFGVFLGTFFVMSLILEVLFRNFFTNRSYYSLISLGLIAVIIYNVVFFTIRGVLYMIGATDFILGPNFGLDLLYQAVAMIIMLSVLFRVINRVSKIFKPTFIKS